MHMYMYMYMYMYIWIYDDICRIFSQKVWEPQATNRSAPFVRGFQHLYISLSDRWLLRSLEGDGDDRVVPSTRYILGEEMKGNIEVKWPINPWLWDEATRVKMHGPQMSTVLASTFGELIFTQPQVDCPLIAWGCNLQSYSLDPTRHFQSWNWHKHKVLQGNLNRLFKFVQYSIQILQTKSFWLPFWSVFQESSNKPIILDHVRQFIYSYYIMSH